MGDCEKEIEKIMGEMKCPKDFECYKSGSNDPHRTRDVGIESFLECLQENPNGCEYSLSFGYSWFCRCPLQMYLVKQFGNELHNNITQ